MARLWLEQECTPSACDSLLVNPSGPSVDCQNQAVIRPLGPSLEGTVPFLPILPEDTLLNPNPHPSNPQSCDFLKGLLSLYLRSRHSDWPSQG